MLVGAVHAGLEWQHDANPLCQQDQRPTFAFTTAAAHCAGTTEYAKLSALRVRCCTLRLAVSYASCYIHSAWGPASATCFAICPAVQSEIYLHVSGWSGSRPPPFR